MDQSAFAHMEKMLRDETAGEYTVGKMLGRGGMAVVYLAEETRLGRKVALKVLPPELTFGHGVDRFLREAKTAATLDHPHIIPIYRIASGGKLFWYAMKFLEGKSLDDVLKERGAFSLEETIEILEQVADALDYAHEHKVIHRDIKPANVMLDSRDRVIITDFGIAKALTEGALTASGSVIGTPYFMSPEQGMGKPVSGASDQYSVAVMAFRMLSGHLPFDGDSAIDILHKHCMMDPPLLSESMPHLPGHVVAAVEKGMAKKADERFPNIKAFVKALKDPNTEFSRPSARTVLINSGEVRAANEKEMRRREAAARAGGNGGAADKTKVMSPVKGTRPAPAPKSHTGLWVALVLVALGGGGTGTWFYLKGQNANDPAQVVTNPTAPTGQTGPTGVSTPPAAITETPAAAVTGSTGSTGISGSTGTTQAPLSTTGSNTGATGTPPNRPRPQSQTQRPPANTPRTQTQTPSSTPTQTAETPPATATPASTATGEATLAITVFPPGEVSIDGVARGEVSRRAFTVTPGEHRIQVKKPGYQDHIEDVTIGAGDTRRVPITLKPVNP